MKEKLKNATFSLPIEAIDKLKKAVDKGYSKSLNSAVREAVELYTAKFEKEELKKRNGRSLKRPIVLKRYSRLGYCILFTS